MNRSLQVPSVPPAAPSNDGDAAPDSGRVLAALSVDVRCDPDAVRVTLTDPRRASIEAFSPLTEAQRTSFALDGWTIGLRAVQSAHRLAEESQLKNIGVSIASDVERCLGQHLERQQSTLGEALRRYFDPRDGQVTQRLESFLKDDGELARTMSAYLAPENGALAKTLAREVGAESPLLRKLSPTDAEGIVCLVERHVSNALQQNHKSLERALDPLAPDGPMARLLGELRRQVSDTEKDQAQKLAEITKQLDANDQGSLLCRMYAETHRGTQAILENLNGERPGSLIATVNAALTTGLDGHRKQQKEALEAFDERTRKTEQLVRDSVTRLLAHRENDSKSPRGGTDFEDAVARFTSSALKGGPYLVDRVGTRAGAQPHSKVGDLEVKFSPDSPYAGSKMVVEAKRDRKYNVTLALAELETARRNRAATVGVFVFAAGHAPAGLSGLRRYGEDILVAWDPEDPATDPYLETALVLGLALAARGQRVGDEGDIRALSGIESRIAGEIERHDTMRKLAENILRDAGKIAKELDTSDRKLDLLLRDAKKTLKALNVEIEDAAAARKTPVALPPGSLVNARKALRAASPANEDDADPE